MAHHPDESSWWFLCIMHQRQVSEGATFWPPAEGPAAFFFLGKKKTSALLFLKGESCFFV